MAGIGATPSSSSNQGDSNKNYTGPLFIITILFFMWGFITCMNDILIPKLKAVFSLTYFQASLIQFTFFTAYFIIAFIYYVISRTKGDPIAKIGYKNTIIIGLIISGIGCFMFYPAAETKVYILFLGALFILASGVTILQIAANPYVALLGKPETSSGRLNLTQAFNSLGTTVAPLVGGALILNAVSEGANSVVGPYIGLAITLFILAVLIKLSKLPRVVSEEEANQVDENPKKSKGALSYSHLKLGVVCIFMYVGAEVSVGSLLVNYLGLENIAGLEEKTAALYLSLYWGGAMIGRFFGAIFLSNVNPKIRAILILFIMLFGLGFSYYLTDGKTELALTYFGIIILNLLAFIVGANNPNRSLGLFATVVCTALLIGSFASGHLAMWAIVSIGLFNSLMFPNIFTLAIKGLGVDTGQGSSLLVMAIVGGALVLPIQSLIADNIGLQISFLLPLICYAYIAFYGFVGSKPKNIEK